MTEQDLERLVETIVEEKNAELVREVRQYRRDNQELRKTIAHQGQQIAYLLVQDAEKDARIAALEEQREDYTSRTATRAGERTRMYERHVQALEQQVRDLGGTPVLEPV